jgi:hypothetical protein
MKNILGVLLVFVSVLVHAQEYNVELKFSFDPIDQVTNCFATFNNVMTNENKDVGIIIQPVIDYNNGKLSSSNWIVEAVGLGPCQYESTLIILFKDDSRIVVNSWNDINCDKVSYFEFEGTDIYKLSTKEIKLMRYVNGFNESMVTGPPVSTDYFKQLYAEIRLFNAK